MQTVALSPRQIKFVSLAASGVSYAEAARRAGYSADSANASKLAKKLAAEIAAERGRLGLSNSDESNPEEDDAERAALIADQRRLYGLAIEAGEIGAAAKCLRAIERLTKKPGKPGRPTRAETPTPKTREMRAGLPVAELLQILAPDDAEVADAVVHT